jgi:hypothetical protein
MMVKGEALKILVDYDLFGINAKDEIGAYLKTDEKTQKHLVYFFQFTEWGELKDEWVERIDPGNVPALHKDFISRVRPMKVTYAA